MPRTSKTSNTFLEKLLSIQARMSGSTDEEIDQALDVPETQGAPTVVVINVSLEENGERTEYALTRTA
jgi:hypothetical protein